MGKQYRILLDVDGVLADPCGTVFDELELGLTLDDIKEWDFFAPMSPENKASAIKLMNSTGFWQRVKPIAGAREAIALLREWADVYAVTSPWLGCKTWGHERYEWLKRHMGITEDHVIIGKPKYCVVGDALVDDKPSNVREWAHAHGAERAFMMDRTYNQGDDWDNRVYGWSLPGYGVDLLRRVCTMEA